MKHHNQETSIDFNSSVAVSELVNNELLTDSFFHPNLGGVTKGGMANHYPMTILSLAGLGASDSEINNFKRKWPRYRAHVSEDLGLIDRNQVTLDNWSDYLGQSHRLLEFKRVFEQGLNTVGTEEFVTQALNSMQLSLPMGLFHPLIQLSFAAMHGDHRLIANALAYMAIRYHNLYGSYPELTQYSRKQPVHAMESWLGLRRNVDEITLLRRPAGGSLSICEQFCFEPNVIKMTFDSGFVINEHNLSTKVAEVCQAAIRLYLEEPALTTLHGVTSCQALADLTLRYGETESNRKVYVKLWTLMWIWLSGLYLEKGFPEQLPLVANGVAVELKNWSDIASKARQIPEVHLIKLVFSCQWLFENVEENELYRVAAMNVIAAKDPHPAHTRWTVAADLVASGATAQQENL